LRHGYGALGSVVKRRRLTISGVGVALLGGLLTGCGPLVSVNGNGTDSGNGWSTEPVFDPSGTKIAFQSLASDLGPNDTNENYELVRLSEPPAEFVIDVVGTTDVDGVCDLVGGDDVDLDDSRRVELPVKEDADQEPPGLNRDERERGASGQDDDASQRFDPDTGGQGPDEPVERRSDARGTANEVRVHVNGVVRVELVLVGETSPAARAPPTHTDPRRDHRQLGRLTAVTATDCPIVWVLR
jgi:hypothetical protein